MASKQSVDGFVAERTLALVGVSRSGKGFGNIVLKELTAAGYTVYPVHPEVPTIGEHPAYPSLSKLPAAVGGVVVVVPPVQAEQVVRDAYAAGIRRVWLQQGATSPAAEQLCRELGMDVVSGECILMFAAPTAWMHRTHRWVWKMLDRLPK